MIKVRLSFCLLGVCDRFVLVRIFDVTFAPFSSIDLGARGAWIRQWRDSILARNAMTILEPLSYVFDCFVCVCVCTSIVVSRRIATRTRR